MLISKIDEEMKKNCRPEIVHSDQSFNLNDKRVFNSLAYTLQQVNSLNIGEDGKDQINKEDIVKNKCSLKHTQKKDKNNFFLCQILMGMQSK